MNWITKYGILLGFCFAACKNESAKHSKVALGESSLIEVEQLFENQNSNNIKIIDFRKKEDYLRNHIPNAIQIWRSDIEDMSWPYNGMMASRKSIENLLSNLGIRNEDMLVLYDDNGSCDAARLWWVLKSYGFNAVKILNGGFHAWIAADGPLTKVKPQFEKSTFKLVHKNDKNLFIGRQELNDLIQNDSTHFILDTRTDDEFSGKRQKLGAASAGRIPNSILMDWAKSVDFNGTGKFKSIPELRALYDKLNLPLNAPIITYCHSGVRSAHTTFVLHELLGYSNVKNYDGSWTEWSYFDDLPFEKDSITTILK